MDAPPGGPLRDGIAPSLTRSTKTQEWKATSMRDDHVSTDTLLLHAAGMTPPNALAAVDNHLRDCTACASVVERARTVAAVVRAQQALIEESPASVSAMAEGLFARVRPDLTTTAQAADGVIDNVAHEPANEVASRLDRLRRFVGSLSFDSLGSPAFAGLRATEAGPRHLAYQSELGDLDLQITSPLRSSADDAIWHVMGQLELHTPSPGRVEIEFLVADRRGTDRLAGATEAHDARRITAMVDDSGYFTVELPAGTWAACTVMDEAVLVFPEFTL